MRFEEKDGALLAYHQGEMLRIESWGEDSLRVRATKLGGFTNEDWALTEPFLREMLWWRSGRWITG